MTNDELAIQLNQLSQRIESSKSNIQTEEATKMSFIIPFFQMLGYDVFNPSEFVPEFTADIGIKKGEKVDYAIFINGSPSILIEAKWCGEKLDKHDSQLFRYFATTNAKFAILTNGIIYKFFTDLDEKNKMDSKPFLELNLLEVKDTQVHELRKFCKDHFDIDTILNSASDLKYTSIIKNRLLDLMSNPTDQLVKLLITDVYEGTKTQKVVDDFKVIVRKSFNQYVSELISDRLKNALDTERLPLSEPAETSQTNNEEINRIVTTVEEMQSFYIIRSILGSQMPLADITFKDTESYFNILHKNNVRKWICRIKIGDKVKNLILPTGEVGKAITIPLDRLEDLYLHKDAIITSASNYISE